MADEKIVAIVQARMGSTRLPGKTLVDIEGKPLLQHVVERIQRSRYIGRVVIATTDQAQDQPIVALGRRLAVEVFRGSEDDVLARFHFCAQAHDAGIVVRVTADDPFKDAPVADRIIEEILADPSLDYVSNTIRPTYPEGLDIEVFKQEALARAYREATKAQDREHVTPYIWTHPQWFSVRNVENDTNLSHLRWTLDTEADLRLAREVYRRLYRPGAFFWMQDILGLLQKQPELSAINENIERFASHKQCGCQHV